MIKPIISSILGSLVTVTLAIGNAILGFPIPAPFIALFIIPAIIGAGGYYALDSRIKKEESK